VFGYRSIYVGFVAEIVVLEQDFPPVLYIYEARSCNLSWSGKAISMTYCVCVCVCVCACSFRYSTWNAHRPCCRLWPVRLYSILPHYLTNRTIFEKKKNWIQSVCFDFLYKLLSETFLILRKSEWDTVIYVLRSSCIVPVIFIIFNETWFSW